MVELTSKCPLKCIHCSSIYSGSVLTIRRILDIIEKYNIEEVILSGGEPFSHPDFMNIANSLLQRGYRVSLNTCGISNLVGDISYNSLSSNKVYNWGKFSFYPLDILSKFNKIYVSIYGSRDIHNSITQSLSFDNTLSFLLICQRLFTHLYGENHNRVFVNTLIFSREQINSLIDLLWRYIFYEKEDLYIPVHIIRLLTHGRAKNIDVLSREEQLNIALDFEKRFPNRIFISESLSHNNCNWKEKLTLLSNEKLINCVAGKLCKDSNKKFICDYVGV